MVGLGLRELSALLIRPIRGLVVAPPREQAAEIAADDIGTGIDPRFINHIFPHLGFRDSCGTLAIAFRCIQIGDDRDRRFDFGQASRHLLAALVRCLLAAEVDADQADVAFEACISPCNGAESAHPAPFPPPVNECANDDQQQDQHQADECDAQGTQEQREESRLLGCKGRWLSRYDDRRGGW